MSILQETTKRSFAYDMSKDVLKKGEIYDTDVITQSIENILSTIRGERLFLLPFGSDLPLLLFEELNPSNGERILDSILDAIETWEDRIVLLRDAARMKIETDRNMLHLWIPYYVKNTTVTTTFERKIFL